MNIKNIVLSIKNWIFYVDIKLVLRNSIFLNRIYKCENKIDKWEAKKASLLGEFEN